jgi:hypothetical protein
MGSVVALTRRGFELAFALFGVIVGVVFIGTMVGGGIYRTECILSNGTHAVEWGAEGAVPYLWSPGDSAVPGAHTDPRVCSAMQV